MAESREELMQDLYTVTREIVVVELSRERNAALRQSLLAMQRGDKTRSRAGYTTGRFEDAVFGRRGQIVGRGKRCICADVGFVRACSLVAGKGRLRAA